jgi:hypothetical protein
MIELLFKHTCILHVPKQQQDMLAGPSFVKHLHQFRDTMEHYFDASPGLNEI